MRNLSRVSEVRSITRKTIDLVTDQVFNEVLIKVKSYAYNSFYERGANKDCARKKLRFDRKKENVYTPLSFSPAL